MDEADTDAADSSQVQVVRLRRYGDERAAFGDDVEVVLGAVVHDVAELDALCEGLTATERQRVQAIRHPSARAQAVTGRARLRELLGATLNCDPRRVEIEVRPDGKPVLRDPHCGIHFNLSHTHDLWASATARRQVGIDLEIVRPMSGAAAMVQRYFGACEAEQFHALPDELKIEGFFRGWTLKEAVLKGIGCGVRELERCRVDLDPRLPPRILGDERLQAEWRVASMRPTETHVLSVAAAVVKPLRWVTS